MSNDFSLPQNDSDAMRANGVYLRRQYYAWSTLPEQNNAGIPLGTIPGPADTDAPEWVRQLLEIAVRDRSNQEAYMAVTPFTFANPYPPNITNDKFLSYALGSITFADSAKALTVGHVVQDIVNTGSNIFEFILPDLGPSTTAPTDIQQYKDLFVESHIQLPEVANRFEKDTSFAWNFVAGPNPCVLERLTSDKWAKIQASFPITDAHLQTLAACSDDSLAAAMQDGRLYYVDHSDMASLRNGVHYQQNGSLARQKYIYAPWIAFVVPKTQPDHGLLQAFAIQCGATPDGHDILTPADGLNGNYAWAIAKNCALAAHNTHHELVSHLGVTHYLMEPVVVAMRRNISPRHPIWGLLNHHFEGTMLINYGATHNLILETRAVDRLIGPNLDDALGYTVSHRKAYSFWDHMLPTRLQIQGTIDSNALPMYPYRDDGLQVWGAINNFAKEFVATFYRSEDDVIHDNELQSWAKEIQAPTGQGGAIFDFGSRGTPGQIGNRADLAELLTMIIWTASAQHAAVNFTQGTDMKFTPANPLAGFTPEPKKGQSYSYQDWLNNLPPIEVAITTINILEILAGTNYTRLGVYFNDPNSMETDFDQSPLTAACNRFKADLDRIEGIINTANNSGGRLVAYLPLLPSRIPASINI